MLKDNLPGPALLATILHGPFEYIDGQTENGAPKRVRASLAELLNDVAPNGSHQVTEAGCILAKNYAEMVTIHVNWPAAIKGPLQGTKFTFMSPAKLVKLAQSTPEYRGQSKPYLNGRQARCSVFYLG